MTYTEQYVYDKVGNVVSMKDKNGVVTNNTYDQLYRLTNTTRGGLSTSYTYDNIDRMLTETNENGTTTYAYSGNNLASITYPDSKSISYEYDIMDNVRKVTDYSNSVFSYRYDPLYNVDDIIQDNRPCVDYYYDVSGALTRTDYRNGSVYYTYDNAMQVTKVKNKWNTTDISEYNYTYDTTGNVKTKSDGTTLTTYTYGLGNRLMSSTDRVTTGVDENGAEVYEETIIDYTYDLDGNLTLKDTTYPESHVHTLMVDGVAENLSSVSRFEQNYFYDNNNRLTKEEDIIIGTPEGDEFPTFYITQVNYTYDNNGNTLTEALTSNSVDGYTKVFTYNKRNQLTGYSKDGTDVASYTYYADGLRRSKTVGTDTTVFYYDRGNIVAEGDGTNITAQNVFGINGIIKRTVGTDTTHYFKDAHGDIKQIANSTGTVIQSYEYDAYGNESDPTATDTNPFRYCGEYYDDETGYIYLRNRYYEPSTQRFITEDPAKDGMNWYAYCGGNPVMFVDPSGLSIFMPGIQDETDVRFVALQNLTDDKLILNKKAGEVYYKESDSIDREVSTNLVRDVIDNDMECEIVVYSTPNGSTGYTYDLQGNVIKTRVSFNPNYTPSQWSYVEGEGYGYRTKPAFMVLGHELVHVVRRMTGIERDRSDSGYYLGGPQPGETFLRNGKPEELETTGIDYVKVINGDWSNVKYVEASKYYYSENALRLEYDRIHQNDIGYVKMGRRAVY